MSSISENGHKREGRQIQYTPELPLTSLPLRHSIGVLRDDILLFLEIQQGLETGGEVFADVRMSGLPELRQNLITIGERANTIKVSTTKARLPGDPEYNYLFFRDESGFLPMAFASSQRNDAVEGVVSDHPAAIFFYRVDFDMHSVAVPKQGVSLASGDARRRENRGKVVLVGDIDFAQTTDAQGNPKRFDPKARPRRVEFLMSQSIFEMIKLQRLSIRNLRRLPQA